MLGKRKKGDKTIGNVYPLVNNVFFLLVCFFLLSSGTVSSNADASLTNLAVQ